MTVWHLIKECIEAGHMITHSNGVLLVAPAPKPELAQKIRESKKQIIEWIEENNTPMTINDLAEIALELQTPNAIDSILANDTDALRKEILATWAQLNPKQRMHFLGGKTWEEKTSEGKYDAS